MRRFITFVAVAMAVVNIACAQTVDVASEKTALLARDAEWAQTAKNVDKYVEFFTPDGTVAVAGMPNVAGAKNIKDMLEPLVTSPGYDMKWKATRVAVASSGEIGYTAGTYAETTQNANGTPVTETGRFVTVWKKVDGVWKVLEDAAGPDAPHGVSSPHVVVPVAAVKWMDAPPFLPKGAKLAVLVGDPTQAVPFTIRLQMPDGYKIAAHTHPTDEHITVISGVFRAGMGKTWDDKALTDLTVGSYANMAAQMPHFAVAKGATVVQVHGIGPFVVNYVNPSDDPSKQ
jgi:uncharacterized protein (TIGR02246 family)